MEVRILPGEQIGGAAPGQGQAAADGVNIKTCGNCAARFPIWIVLDGKRRNVSNRRFCLDCSPWLGRNTSKAAPGTNDLTLLPHFRQRRRRARWVNHSRDSRREFKSSAVVAKGGRCIDCGYAHAVAALEFHHRDAATKSFGIGGFTSSKQRLMDELAKCDLVCANCHRLRHAALDFGRGDRREVELRRLRKIRAVEYMGQICQECGRDGLAAIFEFHHRDALGKEFGISQAGATRRWEKVVAELAKCVMLCANCHREVHAGVRELFDDGLLGLAEDATSYRYEIARSAV